MATISIKQNITIKDPKKSVEIIDALTNEKSDFEHIKPATIKDNTKEVAKIWFKH